MQLVIMGQYLKLRMVVDKITWGIFSANKYYLISFLKYSSHCNIRFSIDEKSAIPKPFRNLVNSISPVRIGV